MTLNHIYSNTSNTTQDITAYSRLYQWSAETHAEEGSVATWTMVVDDPDGIWDFNGHRRIYSYESAASNGNQVIANGFIQRQQVSRGPYRNGAGRIWTLTLADQNTLLHRRIMNGADANRPAETDVRRMEALIGRGGFTQMTELNTVDDSEYFSGVSPVQMSANDYRTQPCGTGYVDSCAQQSGKNYFIWYKEPTGDYSIWYDFAESSNWSGAKRLSNVLADVDNTTTFALDMDEDATLDRDPSRVASGVMLPYNGQASGGSTVNGTVYVQDADTLAEFAAIDWLAEANDITDQSVAEARAERYLQDASTEDDLIECAVKLPAANVNDFMAGMRFQAKFSHLPGYEDFQDFRCLSRKVTEISEDPTRAYKLNLRLSRISITPAINTFGIFYLPNQLGDDVDVKWLYNGDNPDSGNLPDPIRGLVAYGPIVAGPGQPRQKFIVSGTGTITARFVCDVNYLGPSGTFTWSVQKNGVNQISGGTVCGGCFPGWDLSGSFAVAPGDELTAHVKLVGGTTFGIPSGTGQGLFFRVHGDLTP